MPTPGSEKPLVPAGHRRGKEISFPARLRVEALAAGGHGFGRLGGMAVFVPGAAPGDLLEVDRERQAGDYAVARILRILEPSPERREPPCPYLPVCGGCQWQQVAYEGQLRAKEGILADAFRRIGHLAEISAEPIVPSPSEFFYRHRVQLKVLTQRGKIRWGFFASTSHFLVDIDRCLISHPVINLFLKDLGDFILSLGVNPAHVATAEINVDGTGRRVDFILHPRRRRLELPAHGRRVRRPGPDGREMEVMIVNATLVRKLPVEAGDFTFPSGGITLSSGAGVFGQNNLLLNPRLVEKVIEYADPSPEDSVADIYCGVGNYSIPLALRAGRVEGIENNRRACLYGEKNASAQGLGNIGFIQKNAVDALSGLPRGTRTIILNPPRVGAAEIMEGIAALSPERIVYVSCNPATLARDLAILAARGWHPSRLAPFDMFPQTHHLETVALLLR